MVEHLIAKPGAIVTRVRSSGAERDFSLGVNCQCRFSWCYTMPPPLADSVDRFSWFPRKQNGRNLKCACIKSFVSVWVGLITSKTMKLRLRAHAVNKLEYFSFFLLKFARLTVLNVVLIFHVQGRSDVHQSITERRTASAVSRLPTNHFKISSLWSGNDQPLQMQ